MELQKISDTLSQMVVEGTVTVMDLRKLAVQISQLITTLESVGAGQSVGVEVTLTIPETENAD